jgi:Zn-dependent protease
VRYASDELREAGELEPPPPEFEGPPAERGAWRRLLAPVLVGGALLAKLAGSLKFLGIFVSVAAYALIWGWAFGVGFVLLILVHEAGHYVEARRQGLRPALPVFVPFLGAYVALRGQPFDPWRNALVSIAGPIAGGLGALACLAYGMATANDLFYALAYVGFFLNLVNLVPIGILDGGHLLRSWRVLRAGGGRRRPADAQALARIVAVLSLATAVALGVGMFAAHVPQDRL